MNNTVKEQAINQGIGSYIDYLNKLRMKDLKDTLEMAVKHASKSIKTLDINLENSLNIMAETDSKIEDLIISKRGSEKGAHGFIAELAETGILNAKQSLEGLKPIAKLLDDNGKVDLVIDGDDFQMKFYNNYRKALNKAKEYTDMKMIYSKDTVEIVDKIMNDEKNIKVSGSKVSDRFIRNIKNQVNEISEERKEPYTEWMKSSELKYSEVQKGRIKETMAIKENELKQEHNFRAKKLNEEKNNKMRLAQKKAMPTFKEAHDVSTKAALLRGGLGLGLFIYKKNKMGKKLWEFEKEDWIEAGIDFTNESTKGYIASNSIYHLTNVLGFNAPSAAAINSAMFGMMEAVSLYRSKQVDTDGFINLVFVNTADATGAAIGATLGMAIIPIPVIGPMLGSFVVNNAIQIGKNFLNEKEIAILKAYEEDIDAYVETLELKYKEIYKELKEEYKKIGDLQYTTFDLNNNIRLRFMASIELASFSGVQKSSVLKSVNEIDDYFM